MLIWCNTQFESTPITWFPNIGVNQHVTPDIANMASFKPYTGTDQLHVGDDKGLAISHIAHSKIHAPKRTFTFSNIYTYLILKSLCYLLMCFLNSILLCFMLRI